MEAASFRNVLFFCDPPSKQDPAIFEQPTPMFISIMLGGAVAWATLFASCAMKRPRSPRDLLAVTDFASAKEVEVEEVRIGAEEHVLVAPSFAELVYAALAARAQRRRILVVTSKDAWETALREGQSHVRAPLAVLEAAMPGVEWFPSQLVTDSPLEVRTGREAPFELAPARRAYVGGILAHARDARHAVLRAIRETAAEEAIPGMRTRLRAALRACCGERAPPAWARLAIEAQRRATFDARAPTATMKRAIAAAIRTAGGDVVLVPDPYVFTTTPSMSLPRRGSLLVSDRPLRRPRCIAEDEGCDDAALFVLRGECDRGYTYTSSQPRKLAACALSAATGGNVWSTTHSRIEDAARVVACMVLGFPNVLDDVLFSEALM